MRRLLTLSVCPVLIALLAASPGTAAGPRVQIQAGSRTAGYDPATGQFILTERGKAFIPSATFGDFLPDQKGQARAVPVDDALGKGQAIEVVHPSGRTVSLTLYNELPLSCVRTSIHNPTTAAQTIAQYTPLSARIDLGAPAKDLRSLGYDGLAPADQPKTTYMAISVGDPKTRAGVVCGWLTHDRASGIAVSRPQAGGVVVEGRAEYGRLLVSPGKTAAGETLAIGYFDDARDGLELYADTIAKIYKIKVGKVPNGYMTYYHAKALDEKRMPALAAWFDEHLKRFGLDFMQIDEGWQLANRDFTSFDPKGVYPGGMKPTAAVINRHGFAAGIWLLPFGWDHKRPAMAGHKDWFVKRADGSVYAVDWGGDCLDMSNPEAREFLRGVIARMSHDWGFKFFKLDGLWTGLAAKIIYGDPSYRPDNFGDAVFHDPQVTNIEAYRTGLKLVREAAGPEAFFLGCTASQNMRSLAGSIGLVDAMRVGVDSNHSWDGILMNVNVATSIYYLHGRVWHNDPDVLYLTKNFPLDSVRAWASWLAVSGQLHMISDWMPDVPAERLDVVKRTIPNHNLKPRPVDLYESYPVRVWHLTAGEGAARRDVVALFNWDDKPQEVSVRLDRLGLRDGPHAWFDFWENEMKRGSIHEIRETLRPRSCRVIAIRAEKDHPQVVSTSRHVTQGIIDLVEEKWEPAGKDRGTLGGRSRLVGGDPYEIRTMLPCLDNHWQTAGAKLSPADREAGVTIEVVPGKSTDAARVVIRSPVNREVAWEIGFVKK